MVDHYSGQDGWITYQQLHHEHNDNWMFFTNWKSQPLSIHRALYEMKVERDANWYINPIDFMNQGDIY